VHALGLERGQLPLRLRQRQAGLGAIEVRLVGTRVDDDERLAFLDRFAFVELHLIDVARHSGPHFDGVDRLETPRVFVPVGDLLAQDLRDHDLGRGGRLIRCLATAEERCGQRRK
jgi:hypothetical protein